MSEHPIPDVGDEFDGNPLIQLAMRAIRRSRPEASRKSTASKRPAY
jgi:hypothetical protein